MGEMRWPDTSHPLLIRARSGVLRNDMYCCKMETVRPLCSTKIEHSIRRKQEAEGLAKFFDVDNHLKSDQSVPTLMPDGTTAHIQSNKQTSKTNH